VGRTIKPMPKGFSVSKGCPAAFKLGFAQGLETLQSAEPDYPF
jgi:hypothetical protein